MSAHRNDHHGDLKAVLGVDEAGWFPLRMRASDYEARVLEGGTDKAVEEPAASEGEPGEGVGAVPAGRGIRR